MLFLEVFKSRDDVCLWYKLDEVRKGESFKMDSSILTKKEDPSFLTERIYDKIEKEIRINIPLRRRIAKAGPNIAALNIGTYVGVKKADQFDIFDDPNIAEERRKIIGRIQVMDNGLDPKEAQCKILIGDDLAIGERVEISKNNPD